MVILQQPACPVRLLVITKLFYCCAGNSCPQNLHFTASFFIDSAHFGHFFIPVGEENATIMNPIIGEHKRLKNMPIAISEAVPPLDLTYNPTRTAKKIQNKTSIPIDISPFKVSYLIRLPRRCKFAAIYTLNYDIFFLNGNGCVGGIYGL